jgi:hypothetical protein
MGWKYLGAVGAFAAVLAAASAGEPARTNGLRQAQLVPPPFGAPLPGRRSCSAQYQRILQLEAEGLRQLLRLSRGDGDKLCSALDSADRNGIDKLIDPKALEPLLTPDQRELLGALGIDLGKVNLPKLMQRLGIDLSRMDLRQIAEQCRERQGDVERFATSELARLENEMLRCDDRV